ncbi:OLC1v1028344C1 [Oldenlandia corymbosa var. corymbosa]|uniref:OLC1v1028344C1 n=1 Tax=Oldenlandia corymbosa var. corymbosa TaxID=529605 RepID=A0AAV1CBH0_OLDCO|nr:OLC1v1028344C1 [Oldenlandia corymbosa var. corymbosa]
MDFKKLAFPDQLLPQCATPSSRRKVVSGFGFGLLASFFVLTVVFLNVSFKPSSWHPVFQGFNVYFSRGTNHNNSIANKLEPMRGTHSLILNGTHEGNLSKNQSVESSDSSRKGEILEAAHLGNSSEVAKKDSFKNVAEAGILPDESHGVKGSHVDKDGNFTKDASKSLSNQHVSAEGNLKKVETPAPKSSKNADFTDKLLGSRNASKSLSNQNVSAQGNLGKAETPEPNKSSKNAVPAEHLDRAGNKTGSTSQEKKNGSSSSTGNKAIATSGNGYEILAKSNGFHGDCNIFNGRWVKDESKPHYTPGSCPFIDRDFDCYLNKRPDDEYVKWKWQPYNCDIPSMNATDFLERLRGQKLVFVGDSLNRNQWESLVCMLRHSIPDKKRVYEVSGRIDFKKKGVYSFRFEDYNCSVDFVSSPFLVRESSFNGKNGSFETLRLDLMDNTTAMYRDADVLIFNTGHWWTHEKTYKGENYYQEGNHVYKSLNVLEAYRRMLVTWSKWIDKNVNSRRSLVIFRGYSEMHFR